ncbi:leucine-rich repeat and immunoglobulin-like domain-containing nogo receptor-interacting protein 1-B [Mytilus edulis]|uniref:leucine-rich repeat and immunoglobulin-like domain-containing nogo receptor-interacting protein 1-B n=1 Tax=Mytilus edulis TaxID=6550 RepID=UPI0039F05577
MLTTASVVEKSYLRFQLLLVLVLFIITSMQLNTVSTCPVLCTCSNRTGGISVECLDQGLTSIPSDFPNDSLSMILAGNEFSIVETGSFQNYSVLEFIVLAGCRIDVIQPGAFAFLFQLTSLNLADNNIKSIATGTFVGLNNLTTLYV